MEYIYVGDLVNTHGLKGEVRILSDFEYKELVFKKEFKVYVGRNKEELVINSYRPHKIFDMVTFVGITDINDVLGYKGERVYIKRSDLKIDGVLNQDLIGINVYASNRLIGPVKQLIKSKAHDILLIDGGTKNYMVPNIAEFIKSVDLVNNRIEVNEIEGLFNEN